LSQDLQLESPLSCCGVFLDIFMIVYFIKKNYFLYLPNNYFLDLLLDEKSTIQRLDDLYFHKLSMIYVGFNENCYKP
jgi:hypothetical protein